MDLMNQDAAQTARAEAWRRCVSTPAQMPGHATARAQAILLHAGAVTYDDAVELVALVIARMTDRDWFDEIDAAADLVSRCYAAVEVMEARAPNILEALG